MSEVQVQKPQKTWSHLAARRRKPSEYEIVSANLHYNDRDPDAPYELSPGMFMNSGTRRTPSAPPSSTPPTGTPSAIRTRWSPSHLQPDAGRPGNLRFGLFDQFNQREHDNALDPAAAPWPACTPGALPVPHRPDGLRLRRSRFPGQHHHQLQLLPDGRQPALAEPHRLPHQGAVHHLRGQGAPTNARAKKPTPSGRASASSWKSASRPGTGARPSSCST